MAIDLRIGRHPWSVSGSTENAILTYAKKIAIRIFSHRHCAGGVQSPCFESIVTSIYSFLCAEIEPVASIDIKIAATLPKVGTLPYLFTGCFAKDAAVIRSISITRGIESNVIGVLFAQARGVLLPGVVVLRNIETPPQQVFSIDHFLKRFGEWRLRHFMRDDMEIRRCFERAGIDRPKTSKDQQLSGVS